MLIDYQQCLTKKVPEIKALMSKYISMYDDLVYKVWEDDKKEFEAPAKLGRKMQYTG
jgi:hypothetical protein